MASWAQRFSNKSHQKAKPRQLQINYTNKTKPKRQPIKKQQSNIPDHVRYPKKVQDDEKIKDDTDKKENTDKDKEKKEKAKDEKRTIFIFNSFTVSERTILFQLLLLHLDMDDAIDFLESCNKYGRFFNQKSELLYFWKFICERKWGTMHFQKKRRSKASREQQMKKFMQTKNDYQYWMNKCQNWRNKQYTIKYDRKCDRLSFWKDGVKIVQGLFDHDVHNKDNLSYIIIVSQHKVSHDGCRAFDHRLSSSNWYDVEENPESARKKWKFEYCSDYTQRVGNEWINYVNIYGYKRLKVDLMMEHLYIAKRGVRKYNVKIVPYIKYGAVAGEARCYLEKILPFKEKIDEHKIRRCMVSGDFDQSGDRESREVRIIMDIISVRELSLKEKRKEDEKLKVAVYGLLSGLGDRWGLQSMKADIQYVVADYF